MSSRIRGARPWVRRSGAKSSRYARVDRARHPAYVASRDASTTIDGERVGRRPRLMRRPTIRAGARVALVAPAGPLRGPEDLRRAQENVRSLGWEPVTAAHVL